MTDGSLLIGRILDGQALTHVEEVRATDTTINLRGRIAGLTRATLTPENFLAIRDQIIGLANNPDEPFIPMVFQKDPALTQMVRVRAATVNVGPGDLDRKASAGSEWTMELERVGNTPSIESTLLGGFRDINGAAFNAFNFTPWHARPAAALDYYNGENSFTGDGTVRTTETGDVLFSTYTIGIGRRLARWTVAEDHWYDGAATIEQTYPDGAWYRLIGRRPRNGREATGMRITNGALRVTISAAGKLQVQAYTGGAWGDAQELNFAANDGAVTYAVNRVNTWAVRRNSPEQVIVRVTLGLESGGANYPHRVTMDLSLRRGDRMVCVRQAAAGVDLLGRATLTATTAGTVTNTSGANEYAVRTNTADTQGNRFLLVHAGDLGSSYAGDASGAGPCQVSTLVSRARAWSFAAGFEVAGASAVSIDTAAAMINQWAAPFGERTTVVGW